MIDFVRRGEGHCGAGAGPNVEGVQPNDVIAGAGNSAIEAVWETPFSLAVTMAVWASATLPAVAAKVAVVDAEATATAGGTVSAGLLLESATVPPPVRDSVTVQIAAAAAASDPGAQLKPVRTGVAGAGADPADAVAAEPGGTTAPPVPVRARPKPAEVAPMLLVTPTAELVTPAAATNVTTATTPSGITVEFAPASTQR